MAATRLIKKSSKEVVTACRPILDDITELLDKDINAVYKVMQMDDVSSGEWAYRQALRIGELRALNNLKQLIKA